VLILISNDQKISEKSQERLSVLVQMSSSVLLTLFLKLGAAARTHCSARVVTHAGQAMAGSVLPPLAKTDYQHSCEQQKKCDTKCKDKGCHSLAKIVKMNIFPLHTQIVEHFKDGFIHHGWTAKIIVNVFRGRMILQILI